jgi:hypothetical protein
MSRFASPSTPAESLFQKQCETVNHAVQLSRAANNSGDIS